MEISLRPVLLTSAPLALGAAACSTPSPADVLSYDEFKAQAYHDLETDTYVVNGDELVATEQAMRQTYDAYLDSVAGARSGYSVSQQGLIVNRVSGHDDAWNQVSAANITFCVSQSSFGEGHRSRRRPADRRWPSRSCRRCSAIAMATAG